MNEIVLAIDPGTKCGWCVVDKGQYVSGVWKLGAGRTQSPGMRYLRLKKLLQEVKELTDFNVVVFEEVKRHRGTAAAHVYGGMTAIIMTFCDEHNIPYTSIPVGTIKRHATGKGNANKQKMIEAAMERWPKAKFEDDNEADARWIASAYISGEGL